MLLDGDSPPVSALRGAVVGYLRGPRVVEVSLGDAAV